MMRYWRAIAMTAVTALVVAACGGDDGGGGAGGAGGQTPSTLKIGFMGAQTGSDAQLGINISNGVELALEQYNATNPAVRVELNKYDTQGSPDQAPALAQNAIREVVAVVGPAFSGESANAGPILEEAKIPFVSASATRVNLSEQGWQYWRRVLANDGVQGPGLARYITEEIQAKRAAVIDDTSEYGKGLADIVDQAVKSGGGEVVVREGVAADTSDFAPVVNSIKSNNADVVFYGGYYSAAGRFVKQLRDNDVTAPFVSGDGSLDGGFIQGGGEAAEGAILTCTCNLSQQSTDPTVSAFIEAYQAKFNAPPGTYSAEGYDVANMILEAVKAGNTTPDAINNFLKTIDYKGVSKQIKFTPNGELESGTVYVHQVKDGAITSLGDIDTVLGG